MIKLINWSELSRYITGGDRNCIRPKKLPRKHWQAIDDLIYIQLPQWWEKTKREYND